MEKGYYLKKRLIKFSIGIIDIKSRYKRLIFIKNSSNIIKL